MNVVFRVDASNRIGTGHVYRCLALADGFRARGGRVRFVHRMHPGNLSTVIRGRGYDVVELRELQRTPGQEIADGDYAAWLGVPEAEDAAETRAMLEGSDRPDCIIVDHYSLGAAWERALRPLAGGIAAIDDVAREHDCDVLIDQNYFHSPERRYHGRLPAGARRLLGPRYALLADEYRLARAFLKPRRGPVARVLVYYGGADVTGETTRALRVLSEQRFAHLAVDVLFPADAPGRAEVEALARRRPRTTLHGARRSMLDLMIEADLMVGAGGSTTWERCATGLPAVVTVVARNQQGFNEALAKDGLIAYVGSAEVVNDAALAATLEKLLADATAPERMATKAWDITDGWGVHRVAEAIIPTAAGQLSLRPESSSEHRWSIVTPAGLPLGEVALDVRDGRAVVTHSLDASVVERGLESRVLELVAAECERSGLNVRLSLDGAARPAGLALTVLSDRGSWIKEWTPRLAADWLKAGHSVRLVSRVADLERGDLCFLLSVGQVLKPEALAMHRHNLVVHAADLPKGRGWSPMTWQVLEGKDEIVVSLLEAGEKVDSGRIYDQARFKLTGGELLDELQGQVAEATVRLCEKFAGDYPASAERFREQSGEATYYARRTPKDSAFDPTRPLAEQFDLLRIVDEERYPAFFTLRGREYTVHVRPRTKQT